MNEKLRILLSKLGRLERDMAHEKGGLIFCALMKPAGSMDDDWEFLVSATWAVWDDFDPIHYIVDKIYGVCPDEERMMFSGITVVPSDDSDLDDLLDDIEVEHGLVKIGSSHCFKQEFERGYVFTAWQSRKAVLNEAAPYTP